MNVCIQNDMQKFLILNVESRGLHEIYSVPINEDGRNMLSQECNITGLLISTPTVVLFFIAVSLF